MTIVPDLLEVKIRFDSRPSLYPPGEHCAIVSFHGAEFAALGTSRQHAAAEVLMLVAMHLQRLRPPPRRICGKSVRSGRASCELILNHDGDCL